MYLFYFDASALVKRYTPEVGSNTIHFLFGNVPLSRMRCLLLGALEVLWICVRKRNDNRITNDQFAQSTGYLNLEVMSVNSDFKTMSVPDTLIYNSITMIDAHSLNSVDALVLQSALDINTELHKIGERLVLVASDRRLLRAADAEGLLVFNPETDSQQQLTDWIENI
ncbi:MAG: type II toxin-antitoxin system VapC family toxin [Candidatus Poribacteria bacterium]|nr:type II toxin-antitoxin system VapC family toxin [Candidatus Poribacteria bacterium]